jgi:hypothetical protein
MSEDVLVALVGILIIQIIALVGTILRHRRRQAKMTLEERRAAEIVPWFRSRIR